MGYWKKRKEAFGYAFNGIGILFRGEAHARIHGIVAVAVILAGVWLDLCAWEWCAVVLCIGGVFMAEGFNTAIEALADRVSVEKHPLIAKCKDVAAGAVLLFVMGAVVVGLIIFLPKIIRIIGFIP